MGHLLFFSVPFGDGVNPSPSGEETIGEMDAVHEPSLELEDGKKAHMSQSRLQATQCSDGIGTPRLPVEGDSVSKPLLGE